MSYYSYANEIQRDIQSDKVTAGDERLDYGSAIDGTVADMTRNLTQNGVEGTNVLKFYNMISASDFDKFLISKQQESLKKKSLKATAQSIKDKENENFYNLSMKQVLQNTTKTLVAVINDMVIFLNDQHKTFGKLFDIFTKSDRLIYVGLVLMFISVVLYFIMVTS